MPLPIIDQRIVVGPFQCNCRILVCPISAVGIVIDPGDESHRILDQMKKIEHSLGRTIRWQGLLHTHAHLDHVGGTRGVKSGVDNESTSPIFLHADDLPLYQALKMQGQQFGFEYEDPFQVDQFIEHEQVLRFGEISIRVIHTPGHSPGSVCFEMTENSIINSKPTVFTGDTLFQGSVGRTDLWGGDSDLMFKSIRERILSLDDDYRVCPGHGPESLVGIERRKNPYLV